MIQAIQAAATRMSDSPSSPSRSLPPPPSTTNRRLSLSALCNPSPPLRQSPMPAIPDDQPTVSSSSSSRSDPEGKRERPSAPKQLSVDAEDESVMIAASALDDMRSGAKSSTPCSSSPSSYFDATSSATPPTTTSQDRSTSPEESAASAQFVSRVSGLPIVHTALRAYEQSKASSRVVKYGAEMMESSMRSISKPVIDRLPVNQIDEFACRQLDRLGKYGSDKRDRASSQERDVEGVYGDSYPDDTGERIGKLSSEVEAGETSGIDSPRLNGSTEPGSTSQSSRDVVSRSRWHSILYEAGGISAAVSEESMRRLKYCLQWLQYATDHIDGQILVLRNFIASLNAQGEDGNARPISASHMQTLTNVKRDVVRTIRQVVDVVSKYTGGALPEPARSRVRQFILNLPQRWANSAHRQSQVPTLGHSPGQSKGSHKRHRSGLASATSTAPSSPLHSPKVMARGVPPLSGMEDGNTHRQATARPTAGSATQAAQRILTLATESLDMMRNVTGIVKESLDRADVWVDRLRVIGMQRRNAEGDPEDENVRPVSSGVSVGTLGSAGSSTTGTFASFPPSPRSWPADAPSPAATAVNSLDALTLSSLSASGSALATPRSSTQSLPALGGYDWEYTSRKLQTIRDTDEDVAEDDEPMNEVTVTALSALRSSTRTAVMDVDGKD